MYVMLSATDGYPGAFPWHPLVGAEAFSMKKEHISKVPRPVKITTALSMSMDPMFRALGWQAAKREN